MAAVSYPNIDARPLGPPPSTNYATSGLVSYDFSYESLSLRDTILDLGVRFILNCPPEDVSTPSRLMFQVEEAQWFYEDFAREQNPALPPLGFQPFTKILYDTIPIMTTLCPNYSEAIAEFKEYKKGIPVRGGVILNDKCNKVLMVRAWKRPAWGFPRGKINKEEDDRACAIREVMEETGFDMSNYMGDSQYCERNLGGKSYRLYLAYGVPEATVFETRTRKEIEEIKWIPLAELSKKAKPFFLVTPFANWIHRVAKEKRGVATKLSRSQSHALKKALGVSGGAEIQAVHNDEESARQLLGMLRPSAKVAENVTPNSSLATGVASGPTEAAPLANSDRQVLLDLIKGNSVRQASATASTTTASDPAPVSAEVENARHILALLKQEIATEKVVQAPQSMNPQVAAKESLTPTPDAPVLPPNSMLEQLVSSRKSNPARRASKATSKPDVPQNALLNVLKSSGYKRQTKLIDLLAPPKPESEGSYTPGNNPLMDLLETQESAVEDKEHVVSSTRETTSAAETKGGNLAGAGSEASKPGVSKSQEPPNALLALLGSNAPDDSADKSVPKSQTQKKQQSKPKEKAKEKLKEKPKDKLKETFKEKPKENTKEKPKEKLKESTQSNSAQGETKSGTSNADGSVASVTPSEAQKFTTNREASDSLLRLLDSTSNTAVPAAAQSSQPELAAPGSNTSFPHEKPADKDAFDTLMQLPSARQNPAPSRNANVPTREEHTNMEATNSLLQLLDSGAATRASAHTAPPSTASATTSASQSSGKEPSKSVEPQAAELQTSASLLTLLEQTPSPQPSSPRRSSEDQKRRGSSSLIGLLAPFENARLKEGARHRMINISVEKNQSSQSQGLDISDYAIDELDSEEGSAGASHSAVSPSSSEPSKLSALDPSRSIAQPSIAQPSISQPSISQPSISQPSGSHPPARTAPQPTISPAPVNTEPETSNPLLALLGGPGVAASPTDPEGSGTARTSSRLNQSNQAAGFSLMDLLHT